MESSRKLAFSTRAIHAGQAPDALTGAIMTPIYQTSTFVQESPGKFKGDYDYARTANPTRTALEENIASLEEGRYGICFSSGCAAMSAVLHLLKSGDHVLACDDVYGGSFRLLDKVYLPLGIEYSMVSMDDPEKVAAEIRPNTKLIWIETPTNPLLKIIDIAAIAKVARNKGALLAVDNTFASPYLQNPLTLGADIAAHSSTKYLGGHSDLVGGALVTNDEELAKRLHYIQNAIGAIPSPHDCFLLLRSTKTLALRMERHCQNALSIAEWLSAHTAVEKVYYPGLSSHPRHEIAAKQMKAFGGMISVVLKGGLSSARSFLERVKIFSLAESLGGVESLIEHPAIMTHASIPAEQRAALGITDGLVRLSVGIEDLNDLIEDIDASLSSR
ncbi:MAG: cystathionine gamma-synthase [Deltaproteobacteria bacterium]|nr:cystathionine gamma-synthase [Deltaproteobacteria bacterium]